MKCLDDFEKYWEVGAEVGAIRPDSEIPLRGLNGRQFVHIVA